MAYVLCLDRIERIALAALSAGAEVNPEEQRDEFDAWLLSEPEVIDADQADLMRVLGVGRYGRSH